MPFAHRPRYDWRLRTRTLALGARTLAMGILNATPDSFSDGGRYLDSSAALDHALEMLDQGADILDLGGESTRPNAAPITSAEEQARVLPVLRAVLAARPNAVVSIDTYHAETARMAVEAGAEIVNDVSGFLWDEEMGATCAELECGAILMHTRGRPREWRALPPLVPDEVLPLVLNELGERAQDALAAGIAHEAIVLDPGFGFGKSLDENCPLLAHLDALHALGFPLLAGLSRKRFLHSARVQAKPPNAESPNTGLPTAESPNALNPARSTQPGTPHLDSEMWVSATTAANTAAILAGAHILRVHDVRPARQAADLADRVLEAAAITHSSL